MAPECVATANGGRWLAAPGRGEQFQRRNSLPGIRSVYFPLWRVRGRCGGCGGTAMEAVPLSWRKCFALAYGICRKSIASSLSEWLVSYLSRLSLLLANKTLKSFLEVVYGHEFGRYVDSMKAGYARPVCPEQRRGSRPAQSVSFERSFSYPFMQALLLTRTQRGYLK